MLVVSYGYYTTALSDVAMHNCCSRGVVDLLASSGRHVPRELQVHAVSRQCHVRPRLTSETRCPAVID